MSDPSLYSLARRQLRHTFAAFEFRNFRLIWIGNLFSNIGSWMQRVAQPWLVLNISHSPFLLGLDAFAADLPLLTLLLFGGVVADRGNRRLIIIASQVVQMSCAALTAALVFTGKIQVWMVISMSLIVGTAQAFSLPAYQALIPSLVDRKHLGNAIALNSTQFNLSRIIGPTVAGILMAGLGAGWCFALNALSFLALIYAVWAIRIAESHKPPTETAGLMSGVRQIFADRDLASLIWVIFFSSLFSGPLLTFIPVLARDVYHVGANGFGALLSTFGLGALLGAVLIASIEPEVEAQGGRSSRGLRTVMLGAGVAALAVIGTALVPDVKWGAPLIFIAGLAFIVCNATANTRLQGGVPDELRGRAASLFMVSFRGAMPLGNLLSGVTVDRFGVGRALAVNGVLALLSLGAIALFSGRKPASRAAL